MPDMIHLDAGAYGLGSHAAARDAGSAHSRARAARVSAAHAPDAAVFREMAAMLGFAVEDLRAARDLQPQPTDLAEN